MKASDTDLTAKSANDGEGTKGRRRSKKNPPEEAPETAAAGEGKGEEKKEDEATISDETFRTMLQIAAAIGGQENPPYYDVPDPETGNFPLHDACESLIESEIFDLLKKGASLTAQNNNQDTPLHILATQHRWGIINEILDTTIETARASQLDAKKVEQLQEEGVETDPVALIEMLGGKPGDIINFGNVQDAKGRSIFHLAMAGDQAEAAVGLYILDADTDLRDKDKRTPWQLANKHKAFNTLRKLKDVQEAISSLLEQEKSKRPMSEEVKLSMYT